MKRVLALLAAVAMVAGAFAVRDAGTDAEGGDDVAAGEQDDPQADGEADALRLHCASELVMACDQLAEADDRIEVSDERAGVTADALLGGDLETDVWLAPRPWVELVRELAEGDPLGESSDVLARSPIVLVASERTTPDCGGEPVGWRCIGDDAADLRPGIADLDDTAGLFPVAQAGTAFFGDEGYATNDFEAPPEAGGPPFVDWVGALIRAVPSAPPGRLTTPLETMLIEGTATYDFATSIEAVATSTIAGTRQEGVLGVLYPAPVATIDVVAVPATGGSDVAAGDLLELLTGATGREALAGAGWRVDGEPLAPGLDESVTLEAEDGLPAPGVLAALRARVR